MCGQILRGREIMSLAQQTALYTDNALPVSGGPARRRVCRPVEVRWGERCVVIGGAASICVQSMTNTDTVDAIATAIQVNTPQAAQAVPGIREQLDRMGIDAPLIGDFHYNGHLLLKDYPGCAQALSKYRINPGNVGQGAKRDTQFAQMIECACRHEKPVRIGV